MSEEKDHKEVHLVLRKFTDIRKQCKLPLTKQTKNKVDIKEYLRRLNHNYLKDQIELVHNIDKI